MLYEGRTSYNIQSVNIKNYFGELRNDLKMVYYGLYFCEFVDYMTHEGNSEVEIMKLLYQSLRALFNTSIGVELVRYVFELKAIALSGEAPQIFECVKCGSKEGYYRFSVKLGGMLCEGCRRTATDAIKLSTSAIYTLQYIIATNVEKLYSFTVTSEVLRELKAVIDDYRKEYVNHEFKSLELLKIL